MLLFLKELKASFGEYSSCLLLLLPLGAMCFPHCDITVELAELQVHGQVRALDLKRYTLPVVLWCNKRSCMVLVIVLTMCCRNRVQSQLSICTFPGFLVRGEVQSLSGSPGTRLTSGELGTSFSQEKWSFTVE